MNTQENPDHGQDRAIKGQALSEHERVVLLQVAQGYGNKEIANQLGISIEEVKTHKVRLLNKLGLDSRVDLVRLLRDRGGLRRLSYSMDPRTDH